MSKLQHEPMAPGARPELSKTIRSLRERLLGDLRDAAEANFRLSLPLAKAELPAETRARRERLEAWIGEQERSASGKKADRERFVTEAVREAAYTWLNRLVLLRHLEAMGLARPAVLSGGWNSKGYREFRDFAPGLCSDESEGYSLLLRLVFDELALDLPGLFGEVGLSELFPMPPSTLRAVVEALNAPAIDSVWCDDTVLGWVYQYWNDPERERLDAKIKSGKKLEPWEIASKTQMFTDRYMVEWLLQNSLGPMWLAMCKKHGWRADAEDVLEDLDQRRAEWRERRDKGEVEQDALMPIAAGLEDRWKYYVPQPLPDDAIESAPESVRALKILDPACGSGHFLVIAFDLLAALYEEEARHRGKSWSDLEIAASILENNLHGIDIDPRAAQIAAAALHVKAQIHAPGVRPARLNLVAPTLRLAALPEDDPALVVLRREVKAETGIPEALTNRIIKALEGADHLGTLLQVDAEIDSAIKEYEGQLRRREREQGDLLRGYSNKARTIDKEEARASLVDKLDSFLAQHAGGDDLGLRLDGEHLAAGIRFVRMVREGTYDLVIGNPPYQGTSKMRDAKYIARKYPRAKANLYAAFLERGLQLARHGGVSTLVTMSNWMFIQQFSALRKHLLKHYDLRLLGDLGRGAFEEIGGEVVTVAMSITRNAQPTIEPSIALQPTSARERSTSEVRTAGKRAAVLAQVGRFVVQVKSLAGIPETPLIYWWSDALLQRYLSAPKLGETSPGRAAQSTGDNHRFARNVWEVSPNAWDRTTQPITRSKAERWWPFVNGAMGYVWFEPLNQVVNWQYFGLEIKLLKSHRTGRDAFVLASENWFLRPGIAFSMIGSGFTARAHRYRSILGNKGSSLFPEDVASITCSMNTNLSRSIIESLNPSVSFEVGDVNRLPVLNVSDADEIFNRLEHAFAAHEAGRETSVEFTGPSTSSWQSAQEWAQNAIDRSSNEKVPAYEPIPSVPSAEAWLSYSFGKTIGRFTTARSESPALSVPGVMFLGMSDDSNSDGIGDALPGAWEAHFPSAPEPDALQKYLKNDFFGYHRRTYENRPIYLPLSSTRRNFVAFIAIHEFRPDTFSALLAKHLLPERDVLQGTLNDLRGTRASTNKQVANDAEKRYADLQRLHAELTDFIDKIRMCAEQGPPPSDAKTKPREVDASYEMDLDDGVMINAAALWPLLEPQWKDPKKWWKELANAEGKKDYDWSHLAARYFPDRIDGKTRNDPSLAVAHKCFWRYHPARAYAWELRLQDEIGPDFRIDEPDAAEHRTRFLDENAAEAAEIEANEAKRRQRKAAKGEAEPQQELAFSDPDDDEDDTDAA